MAMMHFKLEKFTDKVLRDIAREDRKLRAKAARHIRRRLKAKINKSGPSAPGEPPAKVTGNLIKGLGYKSGRDSTVVGFKAPGHHAMMLEFGAGHKTPGRSNKSGKESGNMLPRPVLFPTMAEEASVVKRILTEERV